MKTILAVSLVFLASCASAPTSSPVKVVVDAQAPMRTVDADSMADVAKHFFAKYSGPARTVNITLTGTLADATSEQYFPKVFPGDISPAAQFQILDAAGAVLESGYVPIVETVYFTREPLIYYHAVGRFIADRLQRLNRAKIHVRAGSDLQTDADLVRSMIFEAVSDTGPLSVEVTMSVAQGSRHDALGVPPVELLQRSAYSAAPLSQPDANPAAPYYIANYPSSDPGNTFFMVQYIIRDASGKILEIRQNNSQVVHAGHEKQYREVVKSIAKRVAELNGTKAD